MSDTRIAMIAIVVENNESAAAINELLHEYSRFIIGRMGIPYREKKVSLISIAIDAPQAEITALSGKLGNLDGVSVKTAYSSIGA